MKPIHVMWIISESLELVESNKAVTPGVKNVDPDSECEKDFTDPIPGDLTSGPTTTPNQPLEPRRDDPANINELFAALTSDNELVMAASENR